MSSTRVTLAGLFGVGEEGLRSDQLPDLTDSESYARLQEQLEGKAGAAWDMARANIGTHMGRLLDIDVVDILVGAWNKARELRKYRDEAAYPPEEVIVVALAKHRLQSSHAPRLELVIAERPIGRLQFAIDVGLTIEGAQLTIQGGRIKRIATGKTAASGTIKCEGVVIGQPEAKLGALPGEIRLGQGVLIPA
jgi:hypothetical protein